MPSFAAVRDRFQTRRPIVIVGSVMALALAGGITAAVVLSQRGPSAAGVSLTACGSALSTPTANAPNDSTSVDAVSSTVGPSGGMSDISVSLGSVDSMNAFDLVLNFDSRRAAVSDVCLDPSWRQALVATWDNTLGALRIAAFRLGVGCEPNSACPLFRVSWTTSAGGESTLTSTSAQIAGSHGDSAGVVPNVTPLSATFSVRASP